MIRIIEGTLYIWSNKPALSHYILLYLLYSMTYSFLQITKYFIKTSQQLHHNCKTMQMHASGANFTLRYVWMITNTWEGNDFIIVFNSPSTWRTETDCVAPELLNFILKYLQVKWWPVSTFTQEFLSIPITQFVINQEDILLKISTFYELSQVFLVSSMH